METAMAQAAPTARSWLLGFAAAMMCCPLWPMPVHADWRVGSVHPPVHLLQWGCRVLGPYATIRRANEVANIARGYRYFAISFHNGDGWYVRVCGA
jgi:hypothetical protein